MPWILSWLHFQAPNTGCTYAKCVCMLPSPPHPPPPVSRKVIAPCFGCSYVSASERGLPSFLPLPFLKPIHPRAFPLPPFCQYGSRVHIQQFPPSLPRRAGSGNTRNLTRDRHNNTFSSFFYIEKVNREMYVSRKCPLMCIFGTLQSESRTRKAHIF